VRSEKLNLSEDPLPRQVIAIESMRDEAVSAWWTLLKVPDHRDFIREIRDVDSPWREGFFAKSTTLMMDVSRTWTAWT
jgi:hypothetical protein